MAYLSVSNVAIRGLSACVPHKVEENKDIPFYTEEEADEVSKAIGVERRHLVSDGMTVSDLACKSAEKLMAELGWERESIDLLCFVTQTPDYITPPTGFITHDKLGLKSDCMVVDLNHGCPGWAVALSCISSMMSNGLLKRALLLDGDILSPTISTSDRESRPLFGDGATATALEFDRNVQPMEFNIGTNSKDGIALRHENGGAKNPWTLKTLKDELDRLSGKLKLSGIENGMDSMSVFSFGITNVPKSIKNLCSKFNINIEEADKILLHQANKFMLKKIAKKLKIDIEKVPLSLKNYGNTTSASIPLTIVSECCEEYSHKRMDTIGCAFGTGLAWAAFHFQTDNIVCPDIITY